MENIHLNQRLCDLTGEQVKTVDNCFRAAKSTKQGKTKQATPCAHFDYATWQVRRTRYAMLPKGALAGDDAPYPLKVAHLVPP